MKQIISIHVSIIKESYASVFVSLPLLILPRCSGKEKFTEMTLFKLSLIKDEQELKKRNRE